MDFDFDEFKKGNNAISYLGLAIIILGLILYPNFSQYGNNALLAFPIPIYLGSIIWKVFFYNNCSKVRINYRKYINYYIMLSGLSVYPVLNLIFNVGFGPLLSTTESTSTFINDTQVQIFKVLILALFIVDTYIMYDLFYAKPQNEFVLSKKRLRMLNKYLAGIENGTKVTLDKIGINVGLTISQVKQYLQIIIKMDPKSGEIIEEESSFIKKSDMGQAIDLLLASLETKPKADKNQEKK